MHNSYQCPGGVTWCNGACDVIFRVQWNDVWPFKMIKRNYQCPEVDGMTLGHFLNTADSYQCPACLLPVYLCK